jgi:hypothetical protein
MKMITTARWALLTLGLLIFHASPAHGLVVRHYDPTRHERFSSGFPANPILNDNFFLSDLDFTGVGWGANSRLNVSLISPQHFVGATHTGFRPGHTVNFVNRLGTLKSYTVGSVSAIPKTGGGGITDLFIGTLSAPIPAADEIGFFPILRLPQNSDYEAQPLVIYGRGGRIGTGVVERVYIPQIGIASGMQVLERVTDLNSGGPDDAYSVSGDSGSPSFVVADGQLALVGTFSVNDRSTDHFFSGDMFVPRHLDRLNEKMASTPFRVTTIPAAAAEVRNLTLHFIQDGTNDVLATARFIGTLPLDHHELESLVITPAGSAVLTTPFGTQLRAGEYHGTFHTSHEELSLDATGAEFVNGRLISNDAPDRFGGRTGTLAFGISPEVCTIGGDCIPSSGTIGFSDLGPGSRTTIDEWLTSSAGASGRWVSVIPEPSALYLAALPAALAGRDRRSQRLAKIPF